MQTQPFVLYFGDDPLVEDLLVQADFRVKTCSSVPRLIAYFRHHPGQEVQLFLTHVDVEDTEDGLRVARGLHEGGQKILVFSFGEIGEGVPRFSPDLLIDAPHLLGVMINHMLLSEPQPAA